MVRGTRVSKRDDFQTSLEAMQNIQPPRKDKSSKSVQMRKNHPTDMRAHIHSGDISPR